MFGNKRTNHQEIGDMIRIENCDPLQLKVLFDRFDNEEKNFFPTKRH